MFIEGWKIMPDDGQQNIDDSALKSVVSIIKDMELKVFFPKLKTSNCSQSNIRDSLCLRESVSKFRDDGDRFWERFTTFIYHQFGEFILIQKQIYFFHHDLINKFNLQNHNNL